MRGTYLRSDVFYSFWSWSSSRQHPAFEMHICGVLFVYLFIVLACELVWKLLVNQKGFLYVISGSGAMVIVVGNGHGDTSSNLGRD